MGWDGGWLYYYYTVDSLLLRFFIDNALLGFSTDCNPTLLSLTSRWSGLTEKYL